MRSSSAVVEHCACVQALHILTSWKMDITSTSVYSHFKCMLLSVKRHLCWSSKSSGHLCILYTCVWFLNHWAIHIGWGALQDKVNKGGFANTGGVCRTRNCEREAGQNCLQSLVQIVRGVTEQKSTLKPKLEQQEGQTLSKARTVQIIKVNCRWTRGWYIHMLPTPSIDGCIYSPKFPPVLSYWTVQVLWCSVAICLDYSFYVSVLLWLLP